MLRSPDECGMAIRHANESRGDFPCIPTRMALNCGRYSCLAMTDFVAVTHLRRRPNRPPVRICAQ